jgi:hypothetical protein
MEIKVIDANGKAAASIAASDDLFGREYNEALIHQIVTAYQANARSGNRKQKGRSEIAKSTRKPWAQRVQAVLVQVWPPAHCGVVVVRFSLILRMRTLARKSTAKCTVLVWLLFFRSWFVMVV